MGGGGAPVREDPPAGKGGPRSGQALEEASGSSRAFRGPSPRQALLLEVSGAARGKVPRVSPPPPGPSLASPHSPVLIQGSARVLKTEYSLEGAGVRGLPLSRLSPDAAPSPWGAHFPPMSPLGPRVGLAGQRGP